jgi:hypothetical protein
LMFKTAPQPLQAASRDAVRGQSGGWLQRSEQCHSGDNSHSYTT